MNASEGMNESLPQNKDVKVKKILNMVSKELCEYIVFPVFTDKHSSWLTSFPKSIKAPEFSFYC